MILFVTEEVDGLGGRKEPNHAIYRHRGFNDFRFGWQNLKVGVAKFGGIRGVESDIVFINEKASVVSPFSGEIAATAVDDV